MLLEFLDSGFAIWVWEEGGSGVSSTQRSIINRLCDRSIDPSIDFDPIAFQGSLRVVSFLATTSDLVHLILYFFVWSVYI